MKEWYDIFKVCSFYRAMAFNKSILLPFIKYNVIPFFIFYIYYIIYFLKNQISSSSIGEKFVEEQMGQNSSSIITY